MNRRKQRKRRANSPQRDRDTEGVRSCAAKRKKVELGVCLATDETRIEHKCGKGHEQEGAEETEMEIHHGEAGTQSQGELGTRVGNGVEEYRSNGTREAAMREDGRSALDFGDWCDKVQTLEVASHLRFGRFPLREAAFVL